MQKSRMLFAAALILMAGCGHRPAEHPAGVRLFAFVDLSASVTQSQRKLWEGEAKKLLQRAGPGWHITVYPIHDQSQAAAPLADVRIPDLRPDALEDETQRYRKGSHAAKKGAQAAFQRAFDEPGRARATDVFGATGRIEPDPDGRPTVAVFFSDMLHATSKWNMGQVQFDRNDIPNLVRGVAERHAWHNKTLEGVRIYCVLNSLSSGQQERGVGRSEREAFYQTLFSALGGQLVLFDTHLGSWEPRQKGGKHDNRTE